MGKKRRKTRTHVSDATDSLQSSHASALTGGQVNGAISSVPKIAVVRHLASRNKTFKRHKDNGDVVDLSTGGGKKMEPEVLKLMEDTRQIFCPYTALSLRPPSDLRARTLPAYAAKLHSELGVSHVLSYGQNGPRITLRLVRMPSGPTLCFKVARFSNSGDVKASLRRPYNGGGGAFRVPAVVVTNNFGDGKGGSEESPQIKLMRLTFQNMFPAVDVTKVEVSRDCRRIVLFNLVRKTKKNDDNEKKDENEDEDDLVELRHYAIRTSPVGLTRPVKRIILSSSTTSSRIAGAISSSFSRKNLPNLNKVDDIADYVLGRAQATRSGYATSDSEASGDEAEHVTLPGVIKRKRGKETNRGVGNKAAIQLQELGPRITLKLYKVERGLCGGDVMYHAYQEKTLEEVAKLKRKADDKVKLKIRRREEQERNVARKNSEKEDKKRRKEVRRNEKVFSTKDDTKLGKYDNDNDENGDDFDDQEDYESHSADGNEN